jgi:replicative superfamily II helicase
MKTAPHQPAESSAAPAAAAANAAAAAPPPPAEAHDAARAALRDLIALAAEAATREAEVAQAHTDEVDQAERELARTRSNIEMRFKGVRDDVQQKSQARLDQINEQFQAELAALKQSDTSRKEMMLDDFERASADIEHKVQQAVWLAESVFEAAQNGLKEEAKKAKEMLATQMAALDELDQSADRLVQQYRQQPPDFLAAEEPLAEGVKPQAAFDAA